MVTAEIWEHTLRADARVEAFVARCLAPECHWRISQPGSAIDQDLVLADWDIHVDQVRTELETDGPLASPAMIHGRRDPAAIIAHRLSLKRRRAATTQKRLAARTVGRELRRRRQKSARDRRANRWKDRSNVWWAWSRTNWATRMVWIFGHVLVVVLALLGVLVLIALILRAILPVVLGLAIIYGAFLLVRRMLTSQ
ncbi:hypothetical protein C6I20_09310 [Aeromicrobium sp. A1-2]|uniref:hypothetical protein n=1 Tax=Aeromicrobium sp. A1-2 TaxID=2107713 RepID=UPI000E5035F2|nr:hypothetical protein [Aeromicrobium sp. A1-2]AXT85366.1 hypothetical protein C6I20_09310 [Aeromicrobium sp. A1-2]